MARVRKPKRSRLDLEVDRIARLRDGGDSECSQSTPLRGTPDSLMNGEFVLLALSRIANESVPKIAILRRKV